MIKYEYKIIELDIPADLTQAITNSFMGDPLSTLTRKQINSFVEKELNILGKDGWLLHNSGLGTLPTITVYRIKGVKNVR